MREVWGSEEADRISHLRVYIAYLRGELEANPGEPELIVTEPGVGYRLSVLENGRDSSDRERFSFCRPKHPTSVIVMP
jgi:DNA-binding winged helix-turn-helix (wHTH) protein